jgi:hypothetical protein
MIPDLLALLFWHRLPLAVARVSPGAAGVLLDGVYLVRGSGLASLGPIVATLLGLLAGTRHQGEAFTGSLLTMCVLATIGLLSAQLGFWATAGYVVGDLLLRQGGAGGLGGIAARVVAAALLLMLTVYVPLLVGAARLRSRRLDERGRPPLITEALTAAVTAAAAVTVWAVATRVLIRPVYAWQSIAPSAAELVPLSQRWEVLVAVAAVAAAFRVWREEAGRGDMVQMHVAELRVDLARVRRRWVTRQSPGRPAWPARLAARAGMLTVLVAGLASNLFQALLAFVFWAWLLEARRRLALLAWPLPVLRTPPLVRLAVALALGYGLSGLLLAVTNGLGPVLASTCLTAALVTLVIAK